MSENFCFQTRSSGWYNTCPPARNNWKDDRIHCWTLGPRQPRAVIPERRGTSGLGPTAFLASLLASRLGATFRSRHRKGQLHRAGGLTKVRRQRLDLEKDRSARLSGGTFWRGGSYTEKDLPIPACGFLKATYGTNKWGASEQVMCSDGATGNKTTKQHWEMKGAPPPTKPSCAHSLNDLILLRCQFSTNLLQIQHSSNQNPSM